jgi:phage terminase small subunit
MAKAKNVLTPKQKRFVEEYLIDLNAIQAAIRAGYSENTARVTGPETPLKPAVAELVEQAFKERAKASESTADMVLAELERGERHPCHLPEG